MRLVLPKFDRSSPSWFVNKPPFGDGNASQISSFWMPHCISGLELFSKFLNGVLSMISFITLITSSSRDRILLSSTSSLDRKSASLFACVEIHP